MTASTGERRARAVLTMISSPGDLKLAGFIAELGAEQTLARLAGEWADTVMGRRLRAVDARGIWVRSVSIGVRFIIPGDEEWPDGLNGLFPDRQVAGLGGVPLGLWARGPGHLATMVRRSVAMVGARASTGYGEAVARNLACELAEDGVCVVSGGAYGIDAASHMGALAVGGRSVGVYAGGLDEAYPRGNTALFERLAGQHLVVSEVPIGARPTRYGFLARNRMIAALTLGTVVVECAARSGARNTATWAAELGRVVMAVPGSVHSEMSVGCHRLIRDHQANLVTGSEEIRALIDPLGVGPQLVDQGPERALDGLDPRLFRIREAMPGHGAITAESLAGVTGEPLGAVIGALAELEMLGFARSSDDGWRLARPKPPSLGGG